MKRHMYGMAAIAVLIAVLLIPLQGVRAQFGLDKLKKEADKASNTLKSAGVTKECEPLTKLKDRLKMIRTAMEGRDETSCRIHFSQAKNFREEAEKQCPGPELTAAVAELSASEEEWKTQQAGAASAAGNRDADLETLRQAKFKMWELDNHYGASWSSGYYGAKDNAPKFYAICKEIDYPGLIKKLDAIMARNPDFMEPQREPRGYYDDVKERYAKFVEFVEDGLTKKVNNCIEEAYSLKAQGKSSLSKAQEMAEAAVTGCQAALLMIPGHAGMTRLLQQAQATLDKVGGEADALYTSAFHKQNAGKIVFSKQRVELKKENPAAMQNNFVGGDLVYGMIYCNKTWKEATGGDYNVHIIIQVDGVQKAEHRFKMRRELWDATYLTMEFVPDPQTMETQGAVKYSKAFAELSPRPHKVSVICQHESYDGPIATGEFDLDLSDGADKMEALYKGMVAAQMAKIRMPEAARKDPAMEKDMLAAVSDWPGKALRAVITDADWTTHRNPISGAIEFRSMHGAIAFKLPEGNCRMFWLDFRQMYNGKGYGKTDDYAVGDSEDIPCENVMK